MWVASIGIIQNNDTILESTIDKVNVIDRSKRSLQRTRGLANSTSGIGSPEAIRTPVAEFP